MNKMKQYYLKTREIFLKKQSLLKLIAAGFLAVVLVGLVLSHMEFYYIEKFFRRSLFGKHMFLAIVTPIILLIPVWRGKAARIFQAAGFIIVPYLAVQLVQDLAGYDTVLTEQVFWMNVFLAQIIYAVFLLLTQNYRAMMFFGTLAVTAIGIANHFVHAFRGTPLFPWDIYSIGTAKEVAGAYQMALNTDIISAILLMIFAVAVATRFGREKISWVKRAADIVVMAAVLIYSITTIYAGGFWYQQGLTLNGWDQNLTYADSGVLGGIFMNGQYMYIEKPLGYSAQGVCETVDKYKTADATLQNTENAVLATESEPIKPHVIAIMNESFSDLAALGDFSADKPYLNNFYSYTDNTIRGNLYVSVLGGTTCNSEFEFLTGNSMYFFGSGYIPYQQSVNFAQPSLATILKEQGYTTVAMHPAAAKNWQRAKVYPLLGFDEFLDIDYFENPEMMRWYYVSDRCDYKYLIKRFEERDEGEKMFIFNITIQNHGGYELTNSGISEYVNVRNGNGRRDNIASQYISVIRESDKALKNLLNYFKNVNEPVILCFFGDHQPNLDQEFLEAAVGKDLDDFTFEDKIKQYKVPFMIWANYDINEENIDAVSLNYLGNILLEKAGLSTNGYGEFLNEIRQEMPVINSLGYMSADGVFHEKGESETTETINDYQKVQYNVFHDRHGRLDELAE